MSIKKSIKNLRTCNNQNFLNIFPVKYDTGSTESENLLINFCQDSFLSFWTIPNPYFIDGSHKKEVCDALIVFENNILIFSDKASSLDSETYKWKSFTKHIDKSNSQLNGAKNKILNNTIFYFDAKCEKQIPLSFEEKNIFLIGTYRVPQETYEINKSNFKLVNKKITSKDNLEFHFGSFEEKSLFFHGIIAQDLNIIFDNFSTVTELINYLNYRKEFFLKSQDLFIENDVIEEYKKINNMLLYNDRELESSYLVDYWIEDFVFNNFTYEIPTELRNVNNNILNFLTKLTRYDRIQLINQLKHKKIMKDFFITIMKDNTLYLLGFINNKSFDLSSEEDNKKFLHYMEKILIKKTKKYKCKNILLWGILHPNHGGVCQWLSLINLPQKVNLFTKIKNILKLIISSLN